MAETTASIEAAPETLMTIGEVSNITGYEPMTLRRLSKAKKIPQGKLVRKGACFVRCWLAEDIPAIIAYRDRMRREYDKRVQNNRKLALKARLGTK